MGEPIILLGQCFVDAIVEVFVVREDDMAAHIIKLVIASVANSELYGIYHLLEVK